MQLVRPSESLIVLGEKGGGGTVVNEKKIAEKGDYQTNKNFTQWGSKYILFFTGDPNNIHSNLGRYYRISQKHRFIHNIDHIIDVE